MKREIRIPNQTRAIEKKRKLTEVAYQLFNEKGYNNINTADIAAAAGLSTGCLYDYFIDKEDIFLDAVKIHNEEIRGIVKNRLQKISMDADLLEILQAFVEVLLEAHNHTQGFQREVMALSMTNPQISNLLEEYNQPETVERMISFFEAHGIHMEHAKERILLFLNVTDEMCHHILYRTNIWCDTEIYKEECIQMLMHLFC